MTEMKTKTELAFWFVLIAATLFCRDYLGVGLIKYFVLAEYLLAFACLKANGIEALIAFSMPFAYGLPFNYIALASVVFIVFKRKVLPEKIVFLALVYLALQELAMTYWYSKIDLGAEAGYISCLVLLVLIATGETRNCKLMLVSFIVGTALAFLIVILRTAETVPLESLLAGSARLGYGGSGAYGADGTVDISSMYVRFNPNEVGYYSLVSLGCGLLLLIKTDISRVLILASMFVALFAGVLSQSRTWMMMVAVLVITMVLLSIRRSRERRRAFIAFGVVLIAAAVIVVKNPLLIETISRRFEGADFVTANGRTELLEGYNNWFIHQSWRAFFGTGVVNYKEVTGLWNSMHNGIQQIYVCLGVVGAAVFVSILVYLGVRCARTAEYITPVNTLPLIVALAFSQSIQIINPWSLVLPFALGFVALGVGGESRNGLHGVLRLRKMK